VVPSAAYSSRPTVTCTMKARAEFAALIEGTTFPESCADVSMGASKEMHPIYKASTACG
jgi:hypothetical protein